MDEPVLFGAEYSVYTRIARLALLEKSVPHRFEPVDVFAPGGPPAEHWGRHPFGRIPAFTHGDVALYEAGAIARYVDEAFPGPALQPASPVERARMTQVISVLDSYAFRPLVLEIYVESVSAPRLGRSADATRLAAALPRAERCLDALARLLRGAYFAGAALSLADLHAAPMLAYFHLAAEASRLLQPHPALRSWWQRMQEREAMRATRFPAEGLA